MSQPIERVNYFNGEYLNADDFRTEQDYGIDKSTWLNRSMFTYGVASGLHISDMVRQRLISISSGMAIDQFGREIILTNTATLSHNCDPGLYYLTITFGQKYAEPVRQQNGESKIYFKRVVEEPVIQLRTDQGDPGLNILLGIITVTSNGRIAAIEYDNGQSMRRQCGVNAGTVHFYLEGVDNPPFIAGFQNRHAHTHGLMVQADQTIFEGPLTCNQAAIIGGGDDQGASLTVRALQLQGHGTISANNTTITCLEGFFPAPITGDVLIAQVEIGPKGERRTVREVLDDYTVTVDLPYDQPVENATWMLERQGLAHFLNAQNQAVMALDVEGNAGIGLSASAPKTCGSSENFVLTVKKEHRVGVNQAQPTQALDVSGNVKADAFIGDGSQLTGITGAWPQSPTNTNDIFYNTGGVAIGSQSAWADLSVSSYEPYYGQGSITSSGTTVTGDTDQFTAQFRPGSIIQVNTGDQPQQATVIEIGQDNSVIVNSPFQPDLTEPVTYQILRPVGAFYNNQTAQPVLLIDKDGKVGINQPVPQAALHVEGDLIVSGTMSFDTLSINNLSITGTLTAGNGALSIDPEGNLQTQNAIGSAMLNISDTATIQTLSVTSFTNTGTLNVQAEATTESLIVNTSTTTQTLTVGGPATAQSFAANSISTQDLEISGQFSIGELAVSGNLSVGGDLSVTGSTIAGPITTQLLSVSDGANSGVLSQSGVVTTLEAPDRFICSIANRSKGSMTLNEHADFILTNPERKVSGRAFAILADNTLCLNFGADFQNGVQIQSALLLKKLTTPPLGTTTYQLVVDASGKVYRAS